MQKLQSPNKKKKIRISKIKFVFIEDDVSTIKTLSLVVYMYTDLLIVKKVCEHVTIEDGISTIKTLS